MAQVGTAVPGNVNLSRQKPYAVSAYSRRVKSLANNAQAFGPDSYINITLDTSTPGSFLDPLQSYLKFDLQIRNSNVFNDFISFGSAGAASLIEEFRIYVQGTPIEEILQYNVFYELAMNQNGQCQQPFNLFKTFVNKVNKEIIHFLFKGDLPQVDTSDVREAAPRRIAPKQVYKENKEEARSVLSVGRQSPEVEEQEQPKKAPIIADKGPGRNDKVTVQYMDGTIARDVKFKSVEADMVSGKCVLIEEV